MERVPAPFPVNRSAVSAYTSAQEGDTKEFKLDTIATKTETATLRKIGAYCKVWVANSNFDNNSPSPDGSAYSDNKLNQAQITALAQKFDAIYPIETALLGYEYGGGPGGNGGADGDAKIQILVFDIDSDFGQERNGMVAGYFWMGDEMNKAGVPASNMAEIFYLDSEMLDERPVGAYSTLIHEFNHMINYNMKVIKTGNQDNFTSWFSEMLSMLAEDVIGPMVGIPFQSGTGEATDHVIWGRIPAWLRGYDTARVMWWPSPSSGTSTIPYYSSNYAFGAYLVRNFGGPELLSAIAQSTRDGRDALDYYLRYFNGTNATVDYALSRFGEALVYSGPDKPSAALSFDKSATARIAGHDYTFHAFDIWEMRHRPSGTELPWQRGPKKFPYNAGERETIIAGTMKLYYQEDWLSKTGSLNIQVPSNGSSNINYSVMVDRQRTR
jgi:hypothetical protein